MTPTITRRADGFPLPQLENDPVHTGRFYCHFVIPASGAPEEAINNLAEQRIDYEVYRKIVEVLADGRQYVITRHPTKRIRVPSWWYGDDAEHARLRAFRAVLDILLLDPSQAVNGDYLAAEGYWSHKAYGNWEEVELAPGVYVYRHRVYNPSAVQRKGE